MSAFGGEADSAHDVIETKITRFTPEVKYSLL